MEKRLKKEDSIALKGVAILLMLFHHCFRTSEKFAGYEVLFAPFQESQIVNLGVYAKICVSIFAFVSGYGLMASFSDVPLGKDSHSVSKWMGKRLISTLSGYWFLVPLAYVAYVIRRGFHFADWGDHIFQKVSAVLYDWLGISGILDTKSLSGAWWYMGAAIVFIVLFPVLFFIIDRWGGFPCILLVFLLPRILGVGFLGGSTAYSFLMIFLVGMLCQKYNFFGKYRELALCNNEKVTSGLKFLLLIIFVLFGVTAYTKLKVPVFWEFHYCLLPFGVIIFCVEYIFKISVIKKGLQYIGKHSYNIWLVHTFVRDWGGKKINIWSVKWFVLVPLLMLVISLIISICINALKKICGYDRVMQKILDKWK